MKEISLLCVVDSSKKKEYSDLNETLWPILDFCGMPYKVHDLKHGKLSVKQLVDISAIVLCQENSGGILSENETKCIAEAVRKGTGLVIFDGFINLYKKPLKNLLGIETRDIPTFQEGLDTGSIRILRNDHYITAAKEREFIYFNKPVSFGNIINIESDHKILAVAHDTSNPVLITFNCNKGKAVVCAFSTNLWKKEYLGHGGGIDDLFWKSIVWAARKPFVMMAMPPFVTMRIDDCSGMDHFRWVEILNKHGFIPSVSLFIEHIIGRRIQKVRELYRKGIAEFTVHAYHWTKQIYWKPRIPKWEYHSDGRDYTANELRGFFNAVERLRRKAGIKWSTVLNSHFGEVGKSAIPFAKKMGIKYLADPLDFSLPYDKWAKIKHEKYKPYGGQGGFIDFHPDYPEFFVVAPDHSKIPQPLIDFMQREKHISARLDLLQAADNYDVELVARYAAFGVKYCLDNLMFGLLVTHEQYIQMFSEEDWDRLWSRYDELTSTYEKIYRNWSYIAEYSKNRFCSKLASAAYNETEGEINCRIEGESSSELYLQVFMDEAGGINRGYARVPSYKGSVEQKFKAKDSPAEFPGD